LTMNEVRDGAGKPAWGFWATFGFGLWVMSMNLLVNLVVVIVFLILQVSSGAPAGMKLLETMMSNGLVLAVSTILASVLSVLLVIVIIKWKSGSDLKGYLALRRINWKTALILIAIVVVFMVAFESLAQLIQYKSTDVNSQIYKTVGWQPLFWLMAVVFAPLFEETLFRGFLFEGFLRSRVGLPGALLLTSAFWAVLHVQYGMLEIAAIFVLGLIIGLARYRTGSLWSALLIHAVFNLASTIAISLQ
jgi:uncharacterized protein